MSRKLVVLAGGMLVLTAVVAMVQAQDSFRRVAYPDTRDTLSNSVRKNSGLADKLQAVRRENVFEDEMVIPAAAPASSGSTRKPARTADARTKSNPAPVRLLNTPSSAIVSEEPLPLEPREPTTFTPEVASEPLTVESPLGTRDDPAAENIPSVLKRAPAGQGGDFVAPATRPAPAARVPSSLPQAPTDSPMSEKQVEAPSSSRRTARLPGTLGTRSPLSSASEKGTLLSGVSPTLRVETIGPAAVKIGKEAVYTVQLSNPGEAEALDVAVTIQLPAWVQVSSSDVSSGVARRKGNGGDLELVWELDRLAARGQEQLTLKLAPQENRPFELGVDWTCARTRATTRIEVQEPQLSMTLAGPKEMLYGETAVYTITLSNPGSGDAENVEVSLLPAVGSVRAKETNRVGSIPAGQQKQLEIELTAREAGAMEVRVGAEADGGLHGEAVASVLVRRASLELVVEGPKLKYAGSSGVFQARLTNSGNAPAEEVSAIVTLPVGAKYQGGVEGIKPGAAGLAWNVGRLAPGAERVVEIKCEFSSAGENRLAIKAKGAAGLSASGEFITTVEALAELKLSVVEPKGPKPVGEDAVYEIKIQNRGTKAARQVGVVAQFSDGIEPARADGARADVVPGQVIFNPIPRIDAGEEVTLRITARAAQEGNHIFRAEIKCSDPETRLVHEGTTRYFSSEATARAANNSATVPTTKKAARPDTLQLR